VGVKRGGGEADISKIVDKAYVGMEFADLAAAPVSALQG
jgi:hypothetical protein